MDNKLKYQDAGSLEVLGSLAGTEKAMVVTPAGVRLAPVAMLGGAAAEAAHVLAWDSSVTSDGGFKFYETKRYAQSEEQYYATPVINEARNNITAPALVDDRNYVSFMMGGVTPSSGKYWFHLAIDFNDTVGDNSVYLSFARSISYDEARGPVPVAYVISLSSTWLELGIPGTSEPDLHYVDPYTSPINFLFCIDFDTGQVDVYNSAGLFHTTVAYPFSGETASSIAGIQLVGQFEIYSTTSGPEVLTVNTTNAGLSPWPIPSGYLPLAMRETAPPADTKGDILIASHAGQYHEQAIVRHSRYLVTEDNDLVELFEARDVALKSQDNNFTADQHFQRRLFIGKNWIINQFDGALGFFMGPKAQAVNERMSTNSDVTDNYIIGASFDTMEDGQGNYLFGGLFNNMPEGDQNVAMGLGFTATLFAEQVTAMGSYVGEFSGKHSRGTYLGTWAGSNVGYDLRDSTFLGGYAGSNHEDDSAWTVPHETATPTVITGNTGLGYLALAYGKFTSYNTAVGYNAMGQSTPGSWTGGENTAAGTQAYWDRRGNGLRNTALGFQSLNAHKGGDRNIAVGYGAGNASQGSDNIFIGSQSGQTSTGVFTDVIGIGRATLPGLGTMNNVVAIGSGATVTGSNQVQLGDSSTTTFVYGTVQSRSDARDKADVRPTVLGLEFITKLRPVDYRWDLRDDYIDVANIPQPPAPLRSEPQPPMRPHTDPGYQEELLAYRADYLQWQEESRAHTEAQAQYEMELTQWYANNDISQIVHDGTHKRSRFHHGLLAQEVQAVAADLGVDFGGFQDHAVSGGKDVKSLGYDEFISPMIRAIQELDVKVSEEKLTEIITNVITSDQVLDLLAARLAARK